MANLEQKVMASVLLIYWGRKVTSPFALKLYGLVAGAVALRELTYLRQVIFNMLDSEGVSRFFTFTTSAFANAEFSVQLAFLVTALLGVLTLRDTLAARLFSRPFLARA